MQELVGVPYLRPPDELATSSNFLLHHLRASDTFNAFVVEARMRNQSLIFEDSIVPNAPRISWRVRIRHEGKDCNFGIVADKVFSPPAPSGKKPTHATFIEYAHDGFFAL